MFWGSNPGFTSNKPTHYLLDYGDMSCNILEIGSTVPLNVSSSAEQFPATLDAENVFVLDLMDVQINQKIFC